jgi:hypothetical protein
LVERWTILTKSLYASDTGGRKELVKIAGAPVGFPSTLVPVASRRQLSCHVLHHEFWQTSPRERVRVGAAREVPVGVDTAGGAAAVVLAALGASVVPAADGWWRMVVVGAVVAVFAAVTADARAAAAVVVLAWLVVNGFLVDRYGQLAWHGDPDLVRLLVLAVCAFLGVLLGRARTPSPARRE